MATEKRLIDAKPLMEDGWHLVKTGKSNAFLSSMSLADVVTVDAVEVVRCKDCKHYHADTFSCDFTPHSKYYERPNWYEEDFCSYGERK